MALPEPRENDDGEVVLSLSQSGCVCIRSYGWCFGIDVVGRPPRLYVVMCPPGVCRVCVDIDVGFAIGGKSNRPRRDKRGFRQHPIKQKIIKKKRNRKSNQRVLLQTLLYLYRDMQQMQKAIKGEKRVAGERIVSPCRSGVSVFVDWRDPLDDGDASGSTRGLVWLAGLGRGRQAGAVVEDWGLTGGQGWALETGPILPTLPIVEVSC